MSQDAAASTSKPGEAPISDTAKLILNICAEFPDGVPDETLKARAPQVDAVARALAINQLLAGGRIDLMRGGGNALLYKMRSLASVAADDKLAGLSNEERLVYHLVQEAGDKGVWMKDIKDKSNLSLAQVRKLLKNMEVRKLLKPVKRAGSLQRKVYMLYDQEPAATVTGGAFYNEEDIDGQFVRLLREQCLKYLKDRQASVASQPDSEFRSNEMYLPVTEILSFINGMKISKVKLEQEDIERVLSTLVFEGLAERRTSSNQVVSYRAANRLWSPRGLSYSPCTFCPVFSDCVVGYEISPKSCAYFSDWEEDLSF